MLYISKLMISEKNKCIGFAEFTEEQQRIPSGLESYFWKMAALKEDKENAACALIYKNESEPRISIQNSTIGLDHVVKIEKQRVIGYLINFVENKRMNRIKQYKVSDVQFKELESINGMPIQEFINLDLYCSCRNI